MKFRNIYDTWVLQKSKVPDVTEGYIFPLAAFPSCFYAGIISFAFYVDANQTTFGNPFLRQLQSCFK